MHVANNNSTFTDISIEYTSDSVDKKSYLKNTLSTKNKIFSNKKLNEYSSIQH